MWFSPSEYLIITLPFPFLMGRETIQKGDQVRVFLASDRSDEVCCFLGTSLGWIVPTTQSRQQCNHATMSKGRRGAGFERRLRRRHGCSLDVYVASARASINLRFKNTLQDIAKHSRKPITLLRSRHILICGQKSDLDRCLFSSLKAPLFPNVSHLCSFVHGYLSKPIELK